MSQTTLENRLSSLELEVARLKARLGQAPSCSTWVDSIAGSMENEPDFEEVLRLGRLARAGSGDAGGELPDRP